MKRSVRLTSLLVLTLVGFCGLSSAQDKGLSKGKASREIQAKSLQEKGASCANTDQCCDALHADLENLRKKLNECCASQATCCSTLQSEIQNVEKAVTTCCDSSTNCCADLKTDISMVQRKLNACCAAQQTCCSTLEAGIASIETKLTECCTSSQNCCDMLIMDIAQLQANLDACCLAQATCCAQIKEALATIIELVTACCNGGGGGSGCCGTCCFITEIPPEGLVLDKPCHYIVLNDLFFNGGESARAPQAAASSALAQECPLPPRPVTFGIVIASTGAQLDFNNHTLRIEGENIGGVVVGIDSSQSSVVGGSIVGDNSPGQVGVAVTSVDSVVRNVSVVNVGASVPVAVPVVVSVVGVVGVVSVSVVAAGVVVAPVVVVVPVVAAQGAESIPGARSRNALLVDPAATSQKTLLIENVSSVGNLNGISFQGTVLDVIVRDVFINNSIEMGITTQTARVDTQGNILFENVMIAHSGLNGIYTTFNQFNWILDRVQISDSGLNGALFAGFKNLAINDTQIIESGAKGLVASIRQSQNVTLSGLQIMNSGDENLRVDNVQNLSIAGSKFINYRPTTLPLVKIQDTNNALLLNNEFMSLGGFSDGLFIRNSHGSILESNLVKVFNNASSSTPTPQPPNTSGNPIEDFIQSKFCNGTFVSGTTMNGSGSNGSNNSGNFIPSGPIGINLQGGVTAMQVRNNVISGTPTIGIAVQTDSLNGFDEGVIIENALIDGAQNSGIFFASALNCAAFGSQILNGQGDGITINAQSSQTAVRGNTLTNNRAFGIRNSGSNSQIYANFAAANGRNYSPNMLISRPTAGVGSLENISG